MSAELPQIHPTPRTVRRLTGDPVSVDAPITVRLDPTLPPQGYQLTIQGDISLVYADEAGRRYGRQTLSGLQATCPGGIPAMQVEDHPAFRTRAFMLDISRSRVPNRATLERIVGVLCTARYNQFQLYMEHTYAYKEHEAVWRDASPLTSADVQWLDKLCQARGIELVPNQNVFGHMENWLAAGPEYLARAELPDGFENAGVIHPPSTLAPNDENIRFVGGMLDELLPQFSSRSVNIGCDETFEVGLGASKDAVEVRGAERVYLDYLAAVWAPLLEQGYEVQFWGDIIVNAPHLVKEIPSGVIPIAWWYERPYKDPATTPWSDATLISLLEADPATASIIRDGFTARTEGFQAAGVHYWVAPGTGAWASFLGRITNAYPNLFDAAQYSGPTCDGYLVTHWGDKGSWEHPSILFGPIMYGGAASWNPEVDPSSSIPVALSEHVFSEPEGRIAHALDLMGGLWEKLGVPCYNASPIFSAFIDDNPQSWQQQPEPSRVDASIATIGECLQLLHEARPASDDGGLIVRELRSALTLAQFGLEELHCTPDQTPARRAQLKELLLEHSKCWLARAQPGGLARSLRNATPICQRYGINTDEIALTSSQEHSFEKIG